VFYADFSLPCFFLPFVAEERPEPPQPSISYPSHSGAEFFFLVSTPTNTLDGLATFLRPLLFNPALFFRFSPSFPFLDFFQYFPCTPSLRPLFFFSVVCFCLPPPLTPQAIFMCFFLRTFPPTPPSPPIFYLVALPLPGYFFRHSGHKRIFELFAPMCLPPPSVWFVPT